VIIKVYVVLKSTTYEFFGVFATKAKAQQKIEETLAKNEEVGRSLYIEEYTLP